MFVGRFTKALAVASVGTGALYAFSDDLKARLGKSQVKLGEVHAFSGGAPYTAPITQSNPEWDHDWDKRNSPSISDVKKFDGTKATRNIILIRHGQYENVGGPVDEEKILTPLGREQAQLTGERLKRLDLNIDAIHESTMTRAKETSAIIQKSLPGVKVYDSDLLREGYPLPPIPDDPNYVSPERYHLDGPRFEAAFRKYIHRASPDQEKDSMEVIVCHANVIRYFVCRALQFPAKGWLRFTLRHASITWIVVRPNGTVSLYCFGDTGHFPPNKMTVF